MGLHCADCDDAYLLATFSNGELKTLVIQHQYSSRICRGWTQTLDVAEWLKQTIASTVERQRSQAQATPDRAPRRARRTSGRSDPQRRSNISPRTDRTPAGRLRSR